VKIDRFIVAEWELRTVRRFQLKREAGEDLI
jgi:hypothetical protein